ncbi:uncharacterized protein V3H82_006618 [Fundulus diaphanus]
MSPLAASLTEVSSASEQMSITDAETSLADASANAPSNKTRKETTAGHGAQTLLSGRPPAAHVCRPCAAEGRQPKPLHAALPPPFRDAQRLPDAGRSYTSTRRRDRLKTSAARTEADAIDLCAAILLGCLFCRPLDCLLDTFRGCSVCVWSSCSTLCGCEPLALLPLQQLTQPCHPCRCPGDLCLPATECLDLAMEISQMLYH